MFVVDVIPLATGIPAGSLSYRSTAEVAVGSLVSVPVRKKIVPGMVVSCVPAVEAKSQLKSAGFMLRSAKLTSQGRIPEEIASAAQEIAAYHATGVASVLGSLLVPALPASVPESFPGGSAYAVNGIEDTYERRVDAYIALAKKEEAVLIVVPTLAEIERLGARFEEAGLAPLLLTGTSTGKKRAALLDAAALGRVVIATPAFAWIPIERLSAIIIERPSAGTYAFQKRPYIDMRVALQVLAKHRSVPIWFGDLPLPLEYRAGTARMKVRLRTPVTIIDARTDKEGEKKPFSAVPEAMLAAINKSVAVGGRAVVLAVRKGYAPAVICRDCGNLVKDERGHPLALVSSKGGPVLRSADGAVKKDADAVCAHCGSWNLMGLGIGIERVAEELASALPDADVIRLDAETGKATRDALARFKKPGTVVVGTEAMLPLLDPRTEIDVAGIASADTLLALPFWRARERLVRIGYQLRERSKHLYIATRMPDEGAFAAISDAASDFFAEESMMREALSYPPFGHLAVFHATGTKARIEEAAALVARALGAHPSTRLADRVLLKGRWRLSIISKFPADTWPDTALAERLAALPLWIETHVDSESLW